MYLELSTAFEATLSQIRARSADGTLAIRSSGKGVREVF